MLADIGVGILISIFITWATGVELTPVVLCLGIIFSLLPDIDMVNIKNHRGVTHYPILYVPLALIIFLVWGTIWGSVFVLGILIHLIHDTLWIGNGIRWLWPFSEKRYRFFFSREIYEAGRALDYHVLFSPQSGDYN